jgi:lysozyme
MANTSALTLIKMFEGCKLHSYLDMVGVWTVGYGQTGKDVTQGMEITEAMALDWLDHSLEKLETLLHHAIKNDDFFKNERKVGAVLSLVYNIGFGRFQTSTMLKKINERADDRDIADEFLRWNKAGGAVVEGLLRRREAERALFLSND